MFFYTTTGVGMEGGGGGGGGGAQGSNLRITVLSQKKLFPK